MKTIKLLLSIVLMLASINTLLAQETIEKTLLHDGETRAYTVYIPSSYEENTAIPLLFNFHGGGGDIASQIAISDMRSLADIGEFIVVYPQALPDPNDDGATLWTHKEPTDVDDIYFVEAMINSLAAEYTIDENRVYACGYSNGGEFAFELACRLSDKIAAIGVVARSMYIETYEACSPAHPTGVVTIHGSEDEYEGITWAGITYYISLDDANSYWANYNNADATPIVIPLPNTSSSDGSTVEYYAWQNGDGCVDVDHYKVIGGGHDWPGSFGNMDIDANTVIWNFVSKYNLNGLINCNSTAVEEIENTAKELLLYPNPTANYITIESDVISNQTFYIYAKTGKLMQTGKINTHKKIINLSALAPSIYFIKVGTQTVKFLKTELH